MCAMIVGNKTSNSSKLKQPYYYYCYLEK